MTILKTSTAALVILLSASVATADEGPANSDVALQDSFDREELGKGWNTTTGSWRIVDGVLRGSEIPAEKHSAATRRVLETRNAVYQLRFRFVDDGKVFHFGFDPARGELEKKGHLFSVIITPTSWNVTKHVDKNRREEDPNEILAKAETEFQRDRWYSLKVMTWENYVTATVEGKDPLKTSHPTFGVKKPTLVFRCLGDGVEIDDVKVWTQKK